MQGTQLFRVANLSEGGTSGALDREVVHGDTDEGLLQDLGVPKAVVGLDEVVVKAVVGWEEAHDRVIQFGEGRPTEDRQHQTKL